MSDVYTGRTSRAAVDANMMMESAVANSLISNALTVVSAQNGTTEARNASYNLQGIQSGMQSLTQVLQSAVK
jgi:hypothetical protein